MRSFILALSAAAVAIPATMVVPTTQAEARRHHYQPREYQGRDGRRYCRHSDGTTGLIVGGVGGALLGNSVAGHGDKTLGTVLGGVAGAFGGRAIDRASTADRRCN
ncbi:glycine zipper 2TM domain-containing protein [Sphingomonas echinoides]|uniref:17 kDa surface antigen n=1 Tax=Sphingomonas echinoides TaxID=59803 RepID=A0ABU4PNU1_9SPHN|nr:glycine zipper 2TM domain-containing protein [Sphingomonas echinoides]MDX5985806.1 glycine zipper 2TM domain-containing protein [Sphingomonas echinoides]